MKNSPLSLIAAALGLCLTPVHGSNSFAGASLVANNSTVTGNSTGATSEPGERSYLGTETMWYRYVAPARGIVRINTSNQLIHHLIHVFRGNSLSALNLVEWDSSRRPNYVSVRPVTVDFPAEAGMEFRICFSDNSSNSGAFSFTIQQDVWPYGSISAPLVIPDLPSMGLAPNDEIAQAKVITSSTSPVSVLDYNYDATQTNLGPEPLITGYRTLWYRWTAPARGIAVISTPASPVLGFRHKVSVFRGNDITNLNGVIEKFADDDEPAIFRFPVEAGMEYKICFGGATSDDADPVIFTIRTDPWLFGIGSVVKPRSPLSSVPPNDQFEGATVIPSALGKYTILDYNFSATTASSTFEPSSIGYKSLWYKWKAPESTYVAVQTPSIPALEYGHVIYAYVGDSYENLSSTPDGIGYAVVNSATTGGRCGFYAKKGVTYHLSFTTLGKSDYGPVIVNFESGPSVNRSGPYSKIASPASRSSVPKAGVRIGFSIAADPETIIRVQLKVNGKLVHNKTAELTQSGGIYTKKMKAGKVKLELRAQDGFGRWGNTYVRYVTAK
jgi:hypothetical protein